MKKITLFLTSILLATTTFAVPSNHWYGGLAIGGDYWQNSKTGSAKMSSGALVPLQNQSNNQMALIGGVTVGAAQEIEQFFFAEQLELLYQTVDNQIDKKVNPTATFTNHVEETQAPTAVLAFLPGLLLNRGWAVYAKLGYAFSQFESNGKNSGIFGPNGDNSTWISGFQTGLGVQRHFPKRWTLRLEYDYTNYGSFSLTGKDDSGIPGGAGGKVTTHYSINTNQIMLNAIYNF